MHRCIGVLDIFGFENFDVNSFPQLCINLTNEKLHHLFIEHIFEVEQRFYETEDIEWSVIGYQNNKPVIDLITRKPGLFALINDASNQKGGATDEALLLNLHDNFDKAPWQGHTYSRPKQPNTFMVHHYAGDVIYTIEGFIERNKDELSKTISALLEEHTKFEQLKRLANDFRKRMETAVLDKQLVPGKGKKKKGAAPAGPSTRQKTVSEFFTDSLGMLMDKLGATDHHYIRCLKPNHTLRPGDWNGDLMLKQLAYSGTLEVTKVRKAGLNVRWPIARFFERYKITAKNMRALTGSSLREQCQNLLVQIELDPGTWRVGKTLVFMASDDVLVELDKVRHASAQTSPRSHRI